MSGIGAFSFLRMDGPSLPSIAPRIELIDRDGNDSTAFRTNAYKADLFQKQTIEGVSALLSAQTAADDYALLKGALVIVVEDIGRTIYYVLVVDVRVTQIQVSHNSSPSGINYLIKADWLLKPTA